MSRATSRPRALSGVINPSEVPAAHQTIPGRVQRVSSLAPDRGFELHKVQCQDSQNDLAAKRTSLIPLNAAGSAPQGELTMVDIDLRPNT